MIRTEFLETLQRGPPTDPEKDVSTNYPFIELADTIKQGYRGIILSDRIKRLLKARYNACFDAHIDTAKKSFQLATEDVRDALYESETKRVCLFVYEPNEKSDSVASHEKNLENFIVNLNDEFIDFQQRQKESVFCYNNGRARASMQHGCFQLEGLDCVVDFLSPDIFKDGGRFFSHPSIPAPHIITIPDHKLRMKKCMHFKGNDAHLKPFKIVAFQKKYARDGSFQLCLEKQGDALDFTNYDNCYARIGAQGMICKIILFDTKRLDFLVTIYSNQIGVDYNRYVSPTEIQVVFPKLDIHQNNLVVGQEYYLMMCDGPQKFILDEVDGDDLLFRDFGRVSFGDFSKNLLYVSQKLQLLYSLQPDDIVQTTGKKFYLFHNFRVCSKTRTRIILYVKDFSTRDTNTLEKIEFKDLFAVFYQKKDWMSNARLVYNIDIKYSSRKFFRFLPSLYQLVDYSNKGSTNHFLSEYKDNPTNFRQMLYSYGYHDMYAHTYSLLKGMFDNRLYQNLRCMIENKAERGGICGTNNTENTENTHDRKKPLEQQEFIMENDDPLDTTSSLVNTIVCIKDVPSQYEAIQKFINEFCVLETDADGRRWYVLYNESMEPDAPGYRTEAFCFHWHSILTGNASLLDSMSTSIAGEPRVCTNCGEQVGNVDLKKGYGEDRQQHSHKIGNVEYAGNYITEWISRAGRGVQLKGRKRRGQVMPQRYDIHDTLDTLDTLDTHNVPESLGFFRGINILKVFTDTHHKLTGESDWQDALRSSKDLTRYLSQLYVKLDSMPATPQFISLKSRCADFERFSVLSRQISGPESMDNEYVSQIKSILKKLYQAGKPPKTTNILVDFQKCKSELEALQEMQINWAIYVATKLWYLCFVWTLPFEPQTQHGFHFPSEFNDRFLSLLVSVENREKYNLFEKELIESDHMLKNMYSRFLDRFKPTGHKTCTFTACKVSEPDWPTYNLNFTAYDSFRNSDTLVAHFIPPPPCCYYIHLQKSIYSNYISQETQRYFHGHFENKQHLEKICKKLNILENRVRYYLGNVKMTTIRPTIKKKIETVGILSIHLVEECLGSKTETGTTFAKTNDYRTTSPQCRDRDDPYLQLFTKEIIKQTFDGFIKSCRGSLDSLMGQIYSSKADYNFDTVIDANCFTIEKFLQRFNDIYIPKKKGGKPSLKGLSGGISEDVLAGPIIKKLKETLTEFAIYSNRISCLSADKFCKTQGSTRYAGQKDRRKVAEMLIFQDTFGGRKCMFPDGSSAKFCFSLMDKFYNACRYMSVVESIDYIFATKNVVRYALLYYLCGQSLSLDSLRDGHISLPRVTDDERQKIFFYFMLKKFGIPQDSLNTTDAADEMTQKSRLRESCAFQSRNKALQLVDFDQAQKKEWCVAIEKNEAARRKVKKDIPQLEDDNSMKRLCLYERHVGQDCLENENYKVLQD